MKKIRKTFKKRRRLGKTDYNARLSLLLSEKPRIVIRKTNKYIISQIVVSDESQDFIISEVNSKDLLNVGWPKTLSGSLKSTPAAYLVGLMLSKKSVKKEAIVDIGLQRNVPRGRLYAVVRGCIDGGMKIPCNKIILPDDKQLESNIKLREIFLKIKEKIKNEKR